MQNKVKLAIFDLDGTLINAYPAVYRSINYTMKQISLSPLDHETIKKTVGWGDRHLLRSFVGDERIEEFLAIYRRHHKDSLKSGSKLLPGAKRLLTFLKKHKYKIAVASNRPTKFSRIVMKHLKIDSYFDYVLCGDKAKRPKPFPDILKQILAKFHLKPKEALYVGDMTIDIQTGKGAKVKTIAVATGSSSKRELAGMNPDYIIDNVFEVAGILKSLNGQKA